MEGWVPASRIAPYNKKNLKRIHEVDIIYSEKVSFNQDFEKQKPPAEPTLLEKEQGELTKVLINKKMTIIRLSVLKQLNQDVMK